MPKVKYYAVKVGREGPKIYGSWEECKRNTDHVPGAIHKSFSSRTQAEAWLNEPARASPYPRLYMAPDDLTLVGECPGTAQAFAPHDNGRVKAEDQRPALLPPKVEEKHHAIASNPVGPQQRPPDIKLSPEQETVLRMVEEGKSVFFTGSAGTGKSVLLREIIRSCRRRGLIRHQLAITASTGIASVNIGGTTVHSWAGIGLGEEPAEKLAGKILGNKNLEPVRDKWWEVQTLIIDEISMIDATLFDKLEYIARKVRREHKDKPFGGIQLVISGDFCQLPPVPGRGKHNVPLPSLFAFEAQTWKECVGPPVILTKVFRQQDQHFVDMLNALRFGRLNDQITNEFRSLRRNVTYTDGIEPTELYPTRREVDNANRSRLAALPGMTHTYRAMDTPGYDDDRKLIDEVQMDKLLQRLVAQKDVMLKVGAQVMLIKNLVQGELVNGSLGKVVDFATSHEALAKSLEISDAEVLENNDKTKKEELKPRIPDRIRAMGIDRLWPVVQFTNRRRMLMVPAEFTVNNASGEVQAKREQVPLICAWALSIHKSQGQTLERVRVDLARTFEKGQAYVALSRATKMDTLQVLNFHPAKVVAHSRVLEWYRSMAKDERAYDSDDLFDEMDNEEAVAAYFTCTST